MPEPPRDSRAKESQATAAEILTELESAPEGQRLDAQSLLLQASFLARLAAALLLEPSEGFEQLLDRDHARHAARHLSESRRRHDQSFSKKAKEPATRDRNPGAPLTDTDRRLGAETAATSRVRTDPRPSSAIQDHTAVSDRIRVTELGGTAFCR